MGNPTNHLRVLPNERRSRLRLTSVSEHTAQVIFTDGFVSEGIVSTPSIGVLLVQFAESTSNREISEIKLSKFSTIKCGEDWTLQKRREKDSGDLLVLVSSHKNDLEDFADLVSPELMLQRSQYSLLSTSAPESASELASILTTIKDCPVQLKGRVRAQGLSVIVTLNFSANSANLARIDVEIDETSAAQLENRTGFLDFNFLSVRYILSITIQEFDSDFNLLALVLNDRHLAISGRRYDRYSCNREIAVKSQSGVINCVLSEISPEGGVILVSSSHLGELQKFETFYIQDSGQRIPFRIQGPKASSNDFHFLRIGFLTGGDCSNLELSKFFFRMLNGRSMIRTPSNYDKLLDLYQTVGYGAKSECEADAWRTNSREIWKKLDSHMPGNCVVYQGEDGKSQVSVGVLPFSRSTIYGHSLASIQSLAGALGVSEQVILTQSWLSFLADCDYYSGSYRKTSKLSTRLQVNFSSGLKPSNQIILHTLSWWNPIAEISGESRFNFELTSATQLSQLDWISNLKRTAVECLMEHPELKVEGHEIRYISCWSKDRNHLVAVAVVHYYPDLATATNFLNHSFLITRSFDESSFGINSELVTFLKSRFGTESVSRASILQGVGPIDQDFERVSTHPAQDYREVFWTFTPREDLSCLNISLARASYNLCRKYGIEGVEAYAKTTLFN